MPTTLPILFASPPLRPATPSFFCSHQLLMPLPHTLQCASPRLPLGLRAPAKPCGVCARAHSATASYARTRARAAKGSRSRRPFHQPTLVRSAAVRFPFPCPCSPPSLSLPSPSPLRSQARLLAGQAPPLTDSPSPPQRAFLISKLFCPLARRKAEPPHAGSRRGGPCRPSLPFCPFDRSCLDHSVSLRLAAVLRHLNLCTTHASPSPHPRLRASGPNPCLFAFQPPPSHRNPTRRLPWLAALCERAPQGGINAS